MGNVFVYGTLKKGFGLNGYLNSSKYLGKAKLPRALLFSFGSVPYVNDSSNKDDIVLGEVYMADSYAEAQIDFIELSAGYYVLYREVELEDGEKIFCKVYFRGPSEHSVLVEDGEFK